MSQKNYQIGMQIHTIRPNLYEIRLKVRDGFSQLAHPQYNSDLIDYDYMVMTVARIASKGSILVCIMKTPCILILQI